MISHPILFSFFFFNDTATTEIYTLSLHDALPICTHMVRTGVLRVFGANLRDLLAHSMSNRSEEHTSELQSPCNLVCRLLLEKKKKKTSQIKYKKINKIHTIYRIIAVKQL